MYNFTNELYYYPLIIFQNIYKIYYNNIECSKKIIIFFNPISIYNSYF